MSSSSFDPDSTLGALLVGTLVSYALFGVATTQAYLYSGRFPDESLKMKAMVGVVWCGELAHAICIGHTIYFLVITNYGHPETLARLPSSLIASTLIGSLVSCFIQSFFAFRIWTLSRNLFIPSICWALSLFRLVPPNVVLFQHGLYEPLFDFIGEWGWLFNTAWAVSAANDLLIASTLVFLLYRRRTVSLKSTVAVIDKMIKWTIETGVVTSIASIIMMSLFVWTRENFIWLALFVVIPRLFSNSLFASLNSRAALRVENSYEFRVPRSRPVIGTLTNPNFSIPTSEFLDTTDFKPDEYLNSYGQSCPK